MDVVKQKISNHHFNEPKYMDMAEQAQKKSQETQHTGIQNVQKEKVKPQTSSNSFDKHFLRPTAVFPQK